MAASAMRQIKSVMTPLNKRPLSPADGITAIKPHRESDKLGWISSSGRSFPRRHRLTTDRQRAHNQRIPCQLVIMVDNNVQQEANNKAVTITGLRPIASRKQAVKVSH